MMQMNLAVWGVYAGLALGLLAGCGSRSGGEKGNQPSPSANTAEAADDSNHGHFALTQPLLTDVAVGAQMMLTVSSQGMADAVTTVAYQPQAMLVSKTLAPGHYKMVVAVSIAGVNLYNGQSEADILGGQVTKATIQLIANGKTPGNGNLQVQILPPAPILPAPVPVPGKGTACDLYNDLNSKPIAMSCALAKFTCQWTQPGGKTYITSPMDCNEVYARLDLLKQMCSAALPLTQAVFDSGVKCTTTPIKSL